MRNKQIFHEQDQESLFKQRYSKTRTIPTKITSKIQCLCHYYNFAGSIKPCFKI